MWRGGLPARRSRRVAIWAAVVGRVAGVDRRGLAREATPADREERRFAGGRAALRVERVERFTGRLGDVFGAGEEDRRPHRFGHQHRGGDRPGPVFFADQRHRGGPLRLGGRGEDGEGGAGGVGGRVGAADPGRVVGREAGVAERFGALARAVSSERGSLVGRRCGAGAGALPVVPTAAAPDDRGDDEDQGQRPASAISALGARAFVLCRPMVDKGRTPLSGWGSSAPASPVLPASAPRSAGTSALIGRFGITRGNVSGRPVR